MVTSNIETVDVTDGARGTVQSTALDEPVHSQADEVKLMYPPAYITVKLDRTKAKLEGLEEGVVPIAPSQMGNDIEVDGEKRRVERRHDGRIRVH